MARTYPVIQTKNERVGIAYKTPSDKLAVNGVISFGNGYNGNIAPDRDGTGNGDTNWGLAVQRTQNVDDYNTRIQFYPNAGTTRKLGLYDARNSEWILYADGNANSAPKTVVNFESQFNNYISVEASTGIKSSGWIHLHRYSENLNVSVGNNGTNIDLLVPNGQLAVGTTDPSSFRARVSGTMQVTSTLYAPQIAETTGGQGVILGNFTGNDSDEWPKVIFYRDTGNNWDEGIIKGSSSRGVFGVSHFGYHMSDQRSFGFHSSSWDTEMEIKGTGQIYQKGPVTIGRTGAVANATLAVENAAWFDSNGSARVLYLEAGSGNGNIIQFQYLGTNKWELVGREGTFYIYKNDGNGSGMKYQIDSSGNHTITGVVTTTSTLRAQGDVIAYYSDMRLKTKLGDIQNPIDKVKALNGFYYEPNEKAQEYGYEKERRIGLSAQDVNEVIPEAVHDAPIGDGYMAVDYAKIVPVLVEAIKEQQKQIDELKAMINGDA